MTDPVKIKFDHTALIGAGLIGSSLARALREAGVCASIAGYDANSKVNERAREIGVIDKAEKTLKGAIVGAELVIVATPVGAVDAVAQELASHAEKNALIIDVGSVKGAIAKAAEQLPEHLHFVPCHPVAGTEQSGPDAGFASLFQGRWCIVTPLDRTDNAYTQAVGRAADLWRAVGADVEIMDAAHHDIALAVTSHLPHLIAFTLVGAADDLEAVTEAEIVKYSAGGFRDFTRIAASDPIMWRDVFLQNKEAVLEVLGRFTEELAVLQRAIRWGDDAVLEKSFARGRALRRAIVEAGQETDAPNFGRDQD